MAERAVAASVLGDVAAIRELYTEDATGSGPGTKARSRDELTVEAIGRIGALLQTEVTFGEIDRRGESVRVEWEATGLHVGPLPLEGTGAVLEPTGLRLRIRAVTVAQFRGDRICSWRSHWEDFALAS